MSEQSKKIELIKDGLTDINNKFHKKQLVSNAFYDQLAQRGFVYKKCLLISIFPDSSSTYCGQIIRQDGKVVKFDIDLDVAQYSSWEDITDKFRELHKKNKLTKPWLKEVIAYDLFLNMYAKDGVHIS